MIILWICGLLNGVMDSIDHHDGYKHWGHFWSRDSWMDRYDDNHTIAEKIMQAAINGWHICKWAMVILFTGSIVLIALFGQEQALHWAFKLSYFPVLLLCFIAGFKTSNR
ncbi:MAG: hypothetical protein WC760_06475 [Bacteroidia bacterium]